MIPSRILVVVRVLVEWLILDVGGATFVPLFLLRGIGICVLVFFDYVELSLELGDLFVPLQYLFFILRALAAQLFVHSFGHFVAVGDHFGPVSINAPDERAERQCRKYGQLIAELTKKMV